jgi:hypothetical protein
MWRRAMRQADLFEQDRDMIHPPALSEDIRRDAMHLLVQWLMALAQGIEKGVADDQDQR